MYVWSRFRISLEPKKDLAKDSVSTTRELKETMGHLSSYVGLIKV